MNIFNQGEIKILLIFDYRSNTN